jgi:UDP-N-acetyl-D-mannosaminuronate dehydrogenase
VNDIADLVGKVDIVVTLVAHDQFMRLTPAIWAKSDTPPLVFDTVNIWNSTEWINTPLKVYHLGVAEWKNNRK